MIALTHAFGWFLVRTAVTGVAQGTYRAADLALLTDMVPERQTPLESQSAEPAPPARAGRLWA